MWRAHHKHKLTELLTLEDVPEGVNSDGLGQGVTCTQLPLIEAYFRDNHRRSIVAGGEASFRETVICQRSIKLPGFTELWLTLLPSRTFAGESLAGKLRLSFKRFARRALPELPKQMA